jgi:hypothetical protein
MSVSTVVQIVGYPLGKKLISFQVFRGSPWNNGNKKREPNLDPPLKLTPKTLCEYRQLI